MLQQLLIKSQIPNIKFQSKNTKSQITNIE